MVTVVIVAALTGLAVALNAYAAQLADHSGDRRAAQEARWERMIAAALGER
ncbi:hypothetical protein [Sphingomonas sp.]|jgi:Na+-driven multidrug efflux pump|uniref:hypothetical protein n=1 Tax=Sphingomonas sp. TaxID=28214 RepID=UPI0035C7F486